MSYLRLGEEQQCCHRDHASPPPNNNAAGCAYVCVSCEKKCFFHFFFRWTWRLWPPKAWSFYNPPLLCACALLLRAFCSTTTEMACICVDLIGGWWPEAIHSRGMSVLRSVL